MSALICRKLIRQLIFSIFKNNISPHLLKIRNDIGFEREKESILKVKYYCIFLGV